MSDKVDDPTGTSLIPIEDLFRSKELLGLSIADIAIMSLQPLIDQLPERSRIFNLGNSVSSGGNFQGSIRTLGNLLTSNMVITDNLQVTGNSTVRDLLIVRENTTIIGNATIKYNAVFGGKAELAGNVKVGENIISSKSLILSGQVEVGGQIIADGDVTTKKKVEVTTIQTLGHLRSHGKLFVRDGVRAMSISLLDPGCEIHGDLLAAKIGVGREKMLNRYISNYDAKSSLTNPVGLVKYLFGSVKNAIVGVNRRDLTTIIEGDIICEDLFLEQCTIRGSINAKRIIIGDGVEIEGDIAYSETIRVLSDREYPARQISDNEILYLPLTPSEP
jgi:cytoskeletal protein CcmA (bactofilin family)